MHETCPTAALRANTHIPRQARTYGMASLSHDVGMRAGLCQVKCDGKVGFDALLESRVQVGDRMMCDRFGLLT